MLKWRGSKRLFVVAILSVVFIAAIVGCGSGDRYGGANSYYWGDELAVVYFIGPMGTYNLASFELVEPDNTSHSPEAATCPGTGSKWVDLSETVIVGALCPATRDFEVILRFPSPSAHLKECTIRYKDDEYKIYFYEGGPIK